MKNEYGIVGVAHIGLPTNDLKKTIEFYKSLGFEVILETYNEKAKEKVAFLQIQNYCIESFENGQAVMADGAYQHVAPLCLSFHLFLLIYFKCTIFSGKSHVLSMICCTRDILHIYSRPRQPYCSHKIRSAYRLPVTKFLLLFR